MGALQTVRELRDAGRYLAALEALTANCAVASKNAVHALEAQLLEAVGKRTQAVSRADQVLGSPTATSAERAICEHVLGEILRDNGEIDAAVERFQRAAILARRAGDLRTLF